MPDQSLQYLRVNDFSPGIFRQSRGSLPLTYTTAGPVGSAAHAYRCCVRPGVGLVPLPSYQLAMTHTDTDASNPICLSIGNMQTLAARGGAVGDIVAATLAQVGHTASACRFKVTRLPIFLIGFTPTTVYSSTSTAFPTNTTSWPMMDFGVFQDTVSNLYSRVVITTDPLSTSLNLGAGPGKWVTVRGWTTPTGTTAPESSNGTFTLLGAIGGYPRVFYHDNRLGIFQVGSAGTVTNAFFSTDSDVLQVSGLLNPTTLTNAGVFFPEMGTFFGTWGSYSTGEFVGIYQEGGAVLIYGDLFAPSQVIKLPGVAGTAGMVNKAALSQAGMIYPRLNDGAYLWNGGNTSQKISNQIPDDALIRARQPLGFEQSPLAQSSMSVWGHWVVFSNNWVYDTITSSWWLIEDPTVLNFGVNCSDGAQSLFASPGIATALAGATATLNTYYFNLATAYTSYRWLSNPIPVTQHELVTLRSVELVASNPTASAATITVTPTVPSGQVARPQQNQSQSAVFTIPAHTVAYRAYRPLGYTDYNVEIQVDATNANAAPVLHEFTVGYEATQTAGVT